MCRALRRVHRSVSGCLGAPPPRSSTGSATRSMRCSQIPRRRCGCRPGRRGARAFAHGFRQAPRGGNREMGQGDPRGKHQGGVRAGRDRQPGGCWRHRRRRRGRNPPRRTGIRCCWYRPPSPSIRLSRRICRSIRSGISPRSRSLPACRRSIRAMTPTGSAQSKMLQAARPAAIGRTAATAKGAGTVLPTTPYCGNLRWNWPVTERVPA
jgi:hypothetical protein